MPTGAITEYIDVAQLALYAFWIFFAGLIYYLRREDKREGYPLESDRSGSVHGAGLAADAASEDLPAARRQHPRRAQQCAAQLARRAPNQRAIGRARRSSRPATRCRMASVQPPTPIVADVPDRTVDDQVRIVPLRVATDFHVEARDPDPRGMAVVGADGEVGGIVRDAWVDRSETILRYLEVGGGVPRRAASRAAARQFHQDQCGTRTGQGKGRYSARNSPTYRASPSLIRSRCAKRTVSPRTTRAATCTRRRRGWGPGVSEHELESVRGLAGSGCPRASEILVAGESRDWALARAHAHFTRGSSRSTSPCCFCCARDRAAGRRIASRKR